MLRRHSTLRRRGRPLGTRIAIIGCVVSAPFLALGCGGEQQTISTPNELLIEARQLASEGQTDQAIEKLNASIDAGPTVWAHRLRAQLLAERGEDEAALQDCEAALELAPDDVDALWIKKELTKPKDQRFQGAFQNPPSSKR